MSSHYFDYASSCPPFPEALEVFNSTAREYFANPSSNHLPGIKANELLESSKQRFLELCKFTSGKLVLTGNGTEANNFVIRGVMEKFPKGHLLLANDVHASTWFATEVYKKRVDVVPINSSGKIDFDKLKKMIKRNTILLSIVHVCNEIGTIHDIKTISEICCERGILLHVDGVQALGHITPDFEMTDVNFHTFSAHKFGGPRGVGGLLLNSENINPQILGGSQEYNLRAGTENLPGFLAALKALEMSTKIVPAETSRLRGLSANFIKTLSEQLKDFKINSSKNGLPGLISLSFPGLMGINLVTELSLKGFAVSTGSACHAHNILPSRIIKALGRTYTEALGTLRISMGRDTTEDSAQTLAETLSQITEKQRLLK